MALRDRLRSQLTNRADADHREVLARGAFVEDALEADRRLGMLSRFNQTNTSVVVEGRTDEELRAAGVLAQSRLAQARWPHQESGASLLSSALARRKLAWTPLETKMLLEAAVGAKSMNDAAVLRLPLAALESFEPAQREPFEPQLRRLLERARAGDYMEPSVRNRAIRRIGALLPEAADRKTLPPSVLVEGDAWARGVRERLGDDPPAALVELVVHLSSLSQVRPSKRWLSETRRLSEHPEAAALVRSMVEALNSVEPAVVETYQFEDGQYAQYAVVVGPNSDTARGAIWALAQLGEPWVAPLLTDVAEYAGKGWHGGGDMREPKIANACAAALGTLGEAAVPSLVRLQDMVKNRAFRKQVTRSLQDAAAAAGISPAQLLERGVPDFGLEAAGRVEQHLGEHEAVVSVQGGKAALGFRNNEGRALKGVPAAVKEHHSQELADLRALVRSINKALPVERRRVESLLATGRTWAFDEWSRLYRDHPLTGSITRQLLWDIDDGDGWRTGWPNREVFADAGGETWSPRASSRVRLWHPLNATPDEVRAWRSFIVEREIRQPFKQAFREVYLLTDAEIATVDHSNRFAAHIVRYPQFGALLRARDWTGNHLGYWDGGYEGHATKELGEDGWRAELFYDLVERQEDDYATASLASTDQVRFSQREGNGWAHRRIDEVPPLVFSEAMRDVDLFVAVTSIAADTAWADRGQRTHLEYWRATTFGELTEAATSRRDALARLLPRMAIAERCELEERFLRVRGHLRTYKIHLGSGNIMMEPNDEYLCIVPERKRSTAKVYLPFEEDGGMLSVIISKALLLADDRSITDRSILSQIHRR